MSNNYPTSGTGGTSATGGTWQGAGAIDSSRLEGVRTRRMLAFVIDYTIVGVLWLVALVPVFFLGILTLGLAWLLYPVLGAVIALLYIGTTMSGPRQATWGMQFFSLRIERLDGTALDFMTAIVHGILFWAAHIVFTPLLLLVALFTQKKQLVQDILLGTVVVRSDR
jgi:uncharacterized RDD family membrane protein YckC